MLTSKSPLSSLPITSNLPLPSVPAPRQALQSQIPPLPATPVPNHPRPISSHHPLYYTHSLFTLPSSFSYTETHFSFPSTRSSFPHSTITTHLRRNQQFDYDVKVYSCRTRPFLIILSQDNRYNAIRFVPYIPFIQYDKHE